MLLVRGLYNHLPNVQAWECNDLQSSYLHVSFDPRVLSLKALTVSPLFAE